MNKIIIIIAFMFSYSVSASKCVEDIFINKNIYSFKKSDKQKVKNNFKIYHQKLNKCLKDKNKKITNMYDNKSRNISSIRNSLTNWHLAFIYKSELTRRFDVLTGRIAATKTFINTMTNNNQSKNKVTKWLYNIIYYNLVKEKISIGVYLETLITSKLLSATELKTINTQISALQKRNIARIKDKELRSRINKNVLKSKSYIQALKLQKEIKELSNKIKQENQKALTQYAISKTKREKTLVASFSYFIEYMFKSVKNFSSSLAKTIGSGIENAGQGVYDTVTGGLKWFFKGVNQLGCILNPPEGPEYSNMSKQEAYNSCVNHNATCVGYGRSNDNSTFSFGCGGPNELKYEHESAENKVRRQQRQYDIITRKTNELNRFKDMMQDEIIYDKSIPLDITAKLTKFFKQPKLETFNITNVETIKNKNLDSEFAINGKTYNTKKDYYIEVFEKQLSNTNFYLKELEKTYISTGEQNITLVILASFIKFGVLSDLFTVVGAKSGTVVTKVIGYVKDMVSSKNTTELAVKVVMRNNGIKLPTNTLTYVNLILTYQDNVGELNYYNAVTKKDLLKTKENLISRLKKLKNK